MYLFNTVSAGAGGAASGIEEYAEATAGLPVMYGVCLQRQYLDANHYPKRLRVDNGYRPFLYRCDSVIYVNGLAGYNDPHCILLLYVQPDRQLGSADAASALAGFPRVAALEIDAPWWTGPA
jgi:hypothetical protein